MSVTLICVIYIYYTYLFISLPGSKKTLKELLRLKSGFVCGIRQLPLRKPLPPTLKSPEHFIYSYLSLQNTISHKILAAHVIIPSLVVAEPPPLGSGKV